MTTKKAKRDLWIYPRFTVECEDDGKGGFLITSKEIPDLIATSFHSRREAVDNATDVARQLFLSYIKHKDDTKKGR